MLKAQCVIHGGLMTQTSSTKSSAVAFLNEFFEHDDLKSLTANAGALLECPILVLDDTFHVTAHYRPLGFSDPLFQGAIRNGVITYEAGAVISRNEKQTGKTSFYVNLDGSIYRRRFVTLISSGVRLGYLICVDTDGHLQDISPETWKTVEQVLAKQAFIETSRKNSPFETAEDILMHLLDGGFSSPLYFHLQASSTYLADFSPSGFALIDLAGYHNQYMGKRHLKDEVLSRFPDSHPFIYNGDVFLFLHSTEDFKGLSSLAEEFHLKVIISDGPGDLFELPALYRTAREALELMIDSRFHGCSVCTVAQLRTPLLLKNLENRSDLIAKKIRALASYDREKDTQYCETLYHYLTCSKSLKKTCDALFTHRNTVLYRIHRIQEDFAVPLDDPAMHADLLLSTSLLLFKEKGPDFFIRLPEDNK